jgi:hypothetical protein
VIDELYLGEIVSDELRAMYPGGKLGSCLVTSFGRLTYCTSWLAFHCLRPCCALGRVLTGMVAKFLRDLVAVVPLLPFSFVKDPRFAFQ